MTNTTRTAQAPGVRDRGIRAALAADPGLGAGNVLHKLIEHGAPLDGPGMTFDTAVDGHPAWEGLTLGELRERVGARAAWLRDRGVGPRDPVAVFVSSAADCFLHLMALNWLGAIPALMNPNIPGDVAAEYIRRLKAVGLLADADHRERLADAERGLELGFELDRVFDVAQTGTGDAAAAPAPYRHHDEDPIAITHSSGTTRMPTAVLHTHGNLFAATRIIRLSKPRARGTDRILSALPAPHAAGIMTMNHALCNRSELLYLSQQNDGAAVVDAIERWKPSGVFGFAVTWAELARLDLGKYAMESVSLWFNTGDCAHEPHIRHLIAAGSHDTVTREGVRRVPGSMFVDGLGSTEMGHSAFHITHAAGTERYGRCVGQTHEFAEIALLDPSTGQEVPVGQVGLCGMKSPTLSPGYWNDSLNTHRNRLNGYYLTGDLLYRDEEGYYYHVDRMVDAIDLGGGEWLYTAMSEERILRTCPDVRDCTVVSAPTKDGVITDVLLTLHPDADPELDRDPAVRAALGDAAAATLRKVLVIPDDRLILGPTGKVRKFLMRQRHLAEMAGTRLPGAGSGADPVPVAAERVRVPFEGEGSGVGPMAWGQRDVWRAMVNQRSWFPIGGRKPLDPGTTVEDVADELNYLLSRFPSMRTRLRVDGGKVLQELFSSGEIFLEVFDADGGADADEVAASVEAHYRYQDYDFTDEWPVRMAVVRRGDEAAHMVVIMHHLATDGNGAPVMIREVADRETAPPQGQQQLEQAAWQNSPAGRRQSDRALRYFEELLRVIPAQRFPGPTDPRTPRFWAAEFESSALRLALPVLARRTGVDGTPLMTALFAVAMARVTDINPVVIRPVVGNRFRQALADVVCHTAQSSLISLDVADTTVEEMIARAYRQGMAALKHAYHDPDDAAELIERITRERGDDLDIGCFLNDRRREQASADEFPEIDPEALEAARQHSAFRWLGKQYDPFENMLVNIDATAESMTLGFEWDTHLMAPALVEELARGIEAVAVEAALDPAAVTGVPASTGTPSG